MIGLLALAAAAAAQPQTILTIDPKHRLVEGVASDGETIWVSSILDRQILACQTSCRVMTTLPAPLHPFAIAWDEGRKRLWVAADCPPGLPAIEPCERGALIALDTKGRIQTRIAPLVGTFHPGDVSATDSHVFVSDSQNGMVFRLLPTGRAIMAVNLPNDGKSGQGTALSPDGDELIIADYSKGIGKTGIDSFKTIPLPRQDGKPLRGIDGLTRCGDVYYGIYNGEAPGALVSFTVGESGITAERLMNLPDPTQITYDGKRLLVVADSGWTTLDKGDFTRTAGTPIIAVPLGDDCKPQ